MFWRDGPKGNYADKCAIDDFLDGAPQFRHSSMPCLSRGEAGAIPKHELKHVRNWSCICEQLMYKASDDYVGGGGLHREHISLYTMLRQVALKQKNA